MSKFFIVNCLICFSCFVLKAQDRLLSFENIKNDTILNSIKFKNIGPTIMSGRVTDLEVNPKDEHHFYVAYASGGVWVTYNNGQTFKPIFDNNATITIGDIAVDWNNKIIYVGTGEVNSSRSSYAGLGIYKSADTGRNWDYLGLPESHHIGKIILNEDNSNDIQVAVLGHLYTYNKERGVFKTTDGGKTWRQTLYLNDSTGCVDLVRKNKNEIYVASWTRTRKAWNFNGSGRQSSIYKSEDNGNTWQKITTGTNGFPQNEGVGRIGIALGKNKIYALLDNQNRLSQSNNENKLTALQIQNMTDLDFLNLKDSTINNYLKENGYDAKYNSKKIKEEIKNKKITVSDIANWVLADADAALFQTPIIGAQLYESNDDGRSWKITHKEKLEGLVFTYGYYFGTISVSPKSDEIVFIAGYPLFKSIDGGKSFKGIDGDNCHPDYHRIWINPNNSNHIIVGNDGGINISYDEGANWIKCNNPAVGQFYAIEVDNAKPYNVYGGLQDNGTWVGSSKSVENTSWHQEGIYNYKFIGGGDGMQVRVDTRDNNTIYSGYQFGYYNRSQKENGKSYLDIHPTNDIGEKPFRFNWQTPIWLSKHNQDILYYGSNYFHRSMNKGEHLEKLSSDLTDSKNKGNVPYATLTTIHESPKRFGLIYCGTDDGNIHISKDAGYSWEKISNSLPQKLWVSRVMASMHNLERVYCTLNGYRNDNFSPYVFVSDNYGKTWNNISLGLPLEPINVVKEDPKNENIIYIGTDNGLYVSFDKGKNYKPWQGNLPRVAIHDIAIQERENEIVLGTHGRSIYISSLDKIQQFDSINKLGFVVFDIDTIKYNPNWGQKNTASSKELIPKLELNFFNHKNQQVYVTIKDKKGRNIFTKWLGETEIGYNSKTIELVSDSPNKKMVELNGKWFLSKGEYFIEFHQMDNYRGSKKLVIQ